MSIAFVTIQSLSSCAVASDKIVYMTAVGMHMYECVYMVRYIRAFECCDCDRYNKQVPQP